MAFRIWRLADHCCFLNVGSQSALINTSHLQCVSLQQGARLNNLTGFQAVVFQS